MPKPFSRQPVLKPQDFYLLLVLAACRDKGTTYAELAAYSGLSMSEVHGALRRPTPRAEHWDRRDSQALFKQLLSKFAFARIADAQCIEQCEVLVQLRAA